MTYNKVTKMCIADYIITGCKMKAKENGRL